ncbi:hypothetical protein [Algoriphagus sp.]|uniref:hypothetical protein n=1 Tax=Algoriphagus sp. TaxID=1872435 RepID=UPI003F6FE897
MNNLNVFKWIVTFCMFIAPIVIYAQKPVSLQLRMANDICKCFEGNKFTIWNKQSRDLLEDCSKSIAIKYKDDLELYFASVNDSSYKSGYEMGKFYFQREIVPLLFSDCAAIKTMKYVND